MVKLTAKQRKRLPKSSFAIKRERKYPIDSKARARNALARVSAHGSAAQKKQVRAAVTKRYPSLKKKRTKARARKKK